MFSCPASSLHLVSSPFNNSAQNSPLFFTSKRSQKGNFLISAAPHTSSQSPKGTPILPNFQYFLETVAAVPTSQKNEAVDKFQREGILRTISEFNHLLMALVTADEYELASKLKSKLSSFGLAPDSCTYSILVTSYCKKNEPNEAKTVLDRMLENGFHPNVATFTTLINSFCQNGRLQDAYKVFDIMTKIGCEPTINTYNCLLKGLCYVGRVEEAYELLLNINKSLFKPDIYTYTAVMDGFCKVGRSNEALELLDEALEMGLTPNAVTYNTLFNGYFKEGRPLDGIVLLKQMKKMNYKPDFISYSTLLHGMLKWGETKAALEMYKEMIGIGYEVDERMTNTLLRRLCRSLRKDYVLLNDVYEVFERMKNEDYAIYSDTYGLVVEAFCNGKESDKAFEILDEMMRAGHSPMTITFSVVIRALCMDGKVDKALSVLMLIHKDRKASRVPFNILINELNRQGRSLGACTVFGLALKRGVVPHREPFQAMRTMNFWLLFVAMLCGMGSGLATINNISQIGESLGYTSVQRSTLVSLWSIWNFVGRFGAGYVSDFLMHRQGWARPLLMTLTLATMAGGHIIIGSGIPGNLYVGSVLVGVCYGSQWSLMPTITSEIFGVAHMGAIFNTIAVASPVGSYLLSVRVIGYIYDKEASSEGNSCSGVHCFMLSFFILASISFFGFLVALFLFIKTRGLYRILILRRSRNSERC